MAKKNTEKKAGRGLFATLGRWLKRMVVGPDRNLGDPTQEEKLESPSVQAVKAFFRRKVAVVALVVLVSMFLFVFIGPLFVPMDLTYTDPLQANTAPNYSMMKVPSALKNDIKTISGFADFTVGLSNSGELYIWGNKNNKLTGIDYSAFPEEVKDGNVTAVSAGSDHVIAITEDGKIVGWGNSNLGQYGYLKNENDPYTQMPEEFITGTIDPNSVDQLLCGYQVTALVLDGRLYMWGNSNANLSLKEVNSKESMNTDVAKVALSNYYTLILKNDGTVTGGQTLTFNRQKAYSNVDGEIKNLKTYLEGRTVVDIAATNNCYALVMEDGSVVVFGAVQFGENEFPAIPADERVVSISGATRHFAVVTDKGTVYSWGHNDGGQTEVNGMQASTVYTGAKQTYLVDENDDLVAARGFKGYLMGTDSQGRDVFTRIIHGGKMTMTIGAVAVIVSTVIAIIVGCVSGYFGGWVDMLLMRVTEICASIPFLPFAMMLSYVIRYTAVGETTRIFIIMVMLGMLSWTGLAQLIRAQVLAEREKEFVIAAQSMGVKESKIAFKHILPNVVSNILVNVTLSFASCMLTESSLSYLGFGVAQPRPTWGNMLNGANNSIVIQNYWWQWVFPALFLAIATISINIIGDALRDVLDPKSSREK